MIEQVLNDDHAMVKFEKSFKKSKAFVDFSETSGDINTSFRKFS
jgi:hypothetical protein